MIDVSLGDRNLSEFDLEQTMATFIAPSRPDSHSHNVSSSPSGMSMDDTVRVPLAPSAGFCIKSLTTEAGFYTYIENVHPPSATSSSSSSSSSFSANRENPNLLEPRTNLPTTRTLQIPPGTKVFLNIAWDKRVPSPPESSEDVIRLAMAGADLDGDDGKGGLGGYYVPVVVSEPREDLDKSGKASIVFDCVFSASLKTRCLKDKEFKLYLIELALEHVEEKAHMTLSRQVGTPNIASKGKLESRTVLMPMALVHPDSVPTAASGQADRHISNETGGRERPGPGSVAKSAAGARASPLIQELPDNSAGGGKKGIMTNDVVNKTNVPSSPSKTKPKSILKQPSSSSFTSPVAAANAIRNKIGSYQLSTSAGVDDNAAVTQNARPPLIAEINSGMTVDMVSGIGTTTGSSPDLDVKTLSALPPLRWKWAEDGERIKVEVDVPNLRRDLHTKSTLDIEPRRIILHVPHKHFLDINLDLSDQQIGKMGELIVSAGSPKPEDGPEGAKKEGEGGTFESLAEAMQVEDSTILKVKGHNAGQALRLKRQRDFDVENARAEWRIGEKKLVISV